LKRAGSRLKGLCPFHEEKTPSFSVDPDRQLFYCFGCQSGGDIFKFVMLYERLKFGEAVEFLAKRFGVPLPVAERQSDDPRERLLEMNRVASKYFRDTLAAQAGAGCREYLDKRSLDDATLEKLGLGFAPPGWDGLRKHLNTQRFSEKEMLEGGLVVLRKSGDGSYDRFRERLIFPIRDVGGRPVAFGGRALGDAQPKYINSPETPAYTKGNHLYGLDLARDAIRREGLAIVVEGYMDLAALVQAGFENVVASLGTAFTSAQARLLARYTERVAFSYDGDAAGAKATERSFDLLLEKGFDVRVVELPGGKDPDDYIREEGSEAYGALLRQAPDYIQYLIDTEAGTRDLNRVEEKVTAVNALLPHIAKLTSAIVRGSWATRLADALQIEEGLVLQELRAALKTARPSIRQRPEDAARIVECEARMVTQLLRSEEERQRWCGELDPDDLAGSQVLEIVQTILRIEQEGGRVDYPHVLEELPAERERELLTRIAFREEPDDGPNVEDCIWALKRKRLAREGRAMVRQLGKSQQHTADSPPDAEEVDRKLAQLQKLARSRDALI